MLKFFYVLLKVFFFFFFLLEGLVLVCHQKSQVIEFDGSDPRSV